MDLSLDQLIESTEIVLMLSLMWKIRKMMKERQHRRKHPLGRRWTRLHNTQENRDTHSWYHTLLQPAALRDVKQFHNWTRMSPTAFNALADKLSTSNLVNKQITRMRKPISVGERLAITLRYYATGDNLKTIAAGYCVGHDTACKIVVDTGIAIYKVLAPDYLKVPDTSMWRKIAIEFSKVWNFPNCIGAIDGKHIAMQAPPNAGSDYFNYKQFHSIILMAICDAQYKFTMIDLGAYGREGDRNVYNTSIISKKLAEGTLGIPPSCKLPYSNTILPHCIVGDDAFPLKPYLLKPFAGRCTGTMPRDERIFNYRLSRARRVIENAFGILAGRWRLFRKPIIAKPENIEHYTRACIVLHNYLIETDQQYASRGYADHFNADGMLIEGGWRSEEGGLKSIPSRSGMNFSHEAKAVRVSFKNYFNSEEGDVPWQNAAVDNDGFDPCDN